MTYYMAVKSLSQDHTALFLCQLPISWCPGLFFFYATDFAFLMICTFENEGKTMFLHKYSEALWFLIFVDME